MVAEIQAANLTGAQVATSVVTIAADQRFKPHFVSLTVGAGGTATVSVGATVIAAVTSGSLNLDLNSGRARWLGGAGDDVTIDSSGNVGYVLVYNTEAA